MGKTLIGTATTDSNGVASVSYVGEGAGVLNIQAELDDGSLQSETYDLLDAVWYDEATTSNHNDEYGTQWTVNQGTLTRNTDYSSVTGDGANSKYWVWNFRSYTFDIIEFDLKKVGGATNDICIQLRDNNYGVLRQVALSTWINTSLDTWYHFKFDFNSKKIYCDNASVNMNDITPTKLLFAVSASTTELQFRNFMVY